MNVIKKQMDEIRQTLDVHTREELVEILGYLFKEYVIEGSAPLASGAATVLNTQTELDKASFAEVVTWLQHHLDVPELSQFEVQNERVSVRIAGRLHPIEPPRQEIPEPVPVPAPVTTILAVATPAPAAPPAQAARPAAIPSNPLAPTPPTAAPSSSPAAPEEPTYSSESRFSRLDVD